MILEVEVPSVGESIKEGVLSRWCVADGQHAEKGQPLFELETDKASTEVPAPESGTVTRKAAEGENVRVGQIVARIDTEGQNGQSQKDVRIEWAAPPRSVTSVARKMAEEHGLDPSRIPGSGAAGRVTKEDVQAEIERRESLPEPVKGPAPATPAIEPASPVTPSPISVREPSGEVTRERMSLLRRRIAERLVHAQHTAAILTTFNDVDMSAVIELRRLHKDAFQKKHGVALGFMSFFVRAAAEALKMYPRVNSQVDGEEVVTFRHHHIGVAVSTPRGLVVPVLRKAGELTFAQIEQAISDFGARARDNKLDVTELQGGTFTISNGGVFGSMLSTPILNPPQSAILGMHRIEDRPVARDGAVVIRPMMYLALSYDHRLIDGREAVGFLVRVKECIENPSRILLDI